MYAFCAVSRAFLLCGLLFTAHPAISADKTRVVNEGAIKDQWALADGVKIAAPGYPAEYAERADNVCVAMGYAINSDGTTSDFSLLKAWGSASGEKEPEPGYWDVFSSAGATALSGWKFKPRENGIKPRTTYTVATMLFVRDATMDTSQLRSHCAIKDLAGFIQKEKAERYRLSGNRQEFEDVHRQQEVQQQEAAQRRMDREAAGPGG